MKPSELRKSNADKVYIEYKNERIEISKELYDNIYDEIINEIKEK